MRPFKPDKSRQTKPSFLSTLLNWVGTNKTGILVNIVSAAIWTPGIWLLSIFWKPTVTATVPHTGLLSLLRSEVRVQAWVLPALFLLPLILMHLSWYVRLYRYRRDRIFGLDFTWAYSFPRGRVARVRARCPSCHASISEQAYEVIMSDNFLCSICHYDSQRLSKDPIRLPWSRVIEARVHKRFTKCPS